MGQQLGLLLPTEQKAVPGAEFPVEGAGRVGESKASEGPEACHHPSLWCDLGSLSPDEGNEVLVDEEDES